jgi:nicotinamidase-related amidase
MALNPLDKITAVVAVDLQIVTTSLPVAGDIVDVVGNAARLVSAFRARGLPVVIARNDLNDPPLGRTSYPRRREFVAEESLAVIREMRPAPGDIVVTRGAWSAFAGTNLDRLLRDRQVTEVVIAGLATNFGVESTARAAYDLGYHVVVASDAVTGPMEDAHHNTLSRILPALGQVASTDEILALLTS